MSVYRSAPLASLSSPLNGTKRKNASKGRTTEALNTNLQLDNIASGLQSIFRRIEMSDVVSLERIKSEFLGKKEENRYADATFRETQWRCCKAGWCVCGQSYIAEIQRMQVVTFSGVS